MYRSRKHKSPEDRKGSRRLESASSRASRRSRQSDPSPSRSSRSRTYEPSPNRSTRSRAFEPTTPSRTTRARTQEHSPARSRRDDDCKHIMRKFEISPLWVSFGTRRQKQESPPRQSSRKFRMDSSPNKDLFRPTQRRFRFDDSPLDGHTRKFRVDSSPSKDTLKSSARRFEFDESPARDATKLSIRSRKVDVSPNRYLVRSRREDTSPFNENIRRESPKLRRFSPSQLRNKHNKLDSYLEDDLYGSTRSLDFTPPSPRLGIRAVRYSRPPLRELPTSARASRSYRISCSCKDEDSDLHYLTKVREILLGDPIKGNTQKPAEILPHMYIGNQSNAESLRLLRTLGVTHVLNCAGFKGPRKNPNANPYDGLGIEYLEFKADDRDGYDMSQHFDEAFRYLDNVKRNGGVCLVHCALGINRSGVTVAAYLMVHSRWPLLKALEFVKKKRGVVLSNHGFQRQLIRFARQQNLLDHLPEKFSLRSESPASEQRFIKSLHQAKYGHWSDALEELKEKPKHEYKEPLPTELGSGPESVLMYRFARFMNRDKV